MCAGWAGWQAGADSSGCQRPRCQLPLSARSRALPKSPTVALTSITTTADEEACASSSPWNRLAGTLGPPLLPDALPMGGVGKRLKMSSGADTACMVVKAIF